MAAVNNSYICLACNTPFSGRKRKYCSKTCAVTDRQLRWNKKRRKDLINHTCIQCGGSFSGYKGRRYCSKSCSYAAQNRQERVRDSCRERWAAEVNKGATPLSFEEWKKKKKQIGCRSLAMDRLAEANAKQAWQHWLNNLASSQWLDVYWLATGKPWTDPRLSNAERYTSKYQFKKGFRDKERERTRMYKWSHPDTVAGWNDESSKQRRWNQAAISADGSVTKNFVKELLRQKLCPYCLCLLTKDNRHLDHVTPLSQDGEHSATNLIACCSFCNGSKGAKKLWQWHLAQGVCMQRPHEPHYSINVINVRFFDGPIRMRGKGARNLTIFGPPNSCHFVTELNGNSRQ